MKTISKTDWNMTHVDQKKIENNVNYIKVPIFENGRVKRNGLEIASKWIPVKIKGVKKGEAYR